MVAGFSLMVPGAGLEPARLAAGDFESPESTNFTTRAVFVKTQIMAHFWVLFLANRRCDRQKILRQAGDSVGTALASVPHYSS